MQYRIDTDVVRFRGLNEIEYRALAPRGIWNKSTKELVIKNTPINLQNIAGVLQVLGHTVPKDIQDMIDSVSDVINAINAERISDHPSNIYDFDLKEGVKLYEHQVRAANLALMGFGIEPDKESEVMPI